MYGLFVCVRRFYVCWRFSICKARVAAEKTSLGRQLSMFSLRKESVFVFHYGLDGWFIDFEDYWLVFLVNSVYLHVQIKEYLLELLLSYNILLCKYKRFSSRGELANLAINVDYLISATYQNGANGSSRSLRCPSVRPTLSGLYLLNRDR